MIDLTVPWTDEMFFPADYPSYHVEILDDFEHSDRRRTHFSAHSHQGTHVDAPAHFRVDGKTIDQFDLEIFSGIAHVAHFFDLEDEPITADLFDELFSDSDQLERLIIATGSGSTTIGYDEFLKVSPYLTESAAEWLISKDISLVALDCLTENPALSTASDSTREHVVHKTLFDADIPIVERLVNTTDLADFQTVTLHCLPLPLIGLEASPVRAIAQP